MNDNLLSQFDKLESQLVEIYNSFGFEIMQHPWASEERETLYVQREEVRGLLHSVRETLRQAAPELYPDL